MLVNTSLESMQTLHVCIALSRQQVVNVAISNQHLKCNALTKQQSSAMSRQQHF